MHCIRLSFLSLDTTTTTTTNTTFRPPSTTTTTTANNNYNYNNSTTLHYVGVSGLGHRLIRSSNAYHLAKALNISQLSIFWRGDCPRRYKPQPNIFEYLFGNNHHQQQQQQSSSTILRVFPTRITTRKGESSRLLSNISFETDDPDKTNFVQLENLFFCQLRQMIFLARLVHPIGQLCRGGGSSGVNNCI